MQPMNHEEIELPGGKKVPFKFSQFNCSICDKTHSVGLRGDTTLTSFPCYDCWKKSQIASGKMSATESKIDDDDFDFGDSPYALF
jgi:hypothetical protein